MDNHGDEPRDVATDLWADMPNFEKEKFGGNNEEGFENLAKVDDETTGPDRPKIIKGEAENYQRQTPKAE